MQIIIDVDKELIEYFSKHNCMNDDGWYSHSAKLLNAFRNGTPLPEQHQRVSCENCCNGNQEEKAKLCQKSYLAGMDHNQESAENASWEQTGRIFTAPDGQIVREYMCSRCSALAYFRSGAGKPVGGEYCPSCMTKMKG